MKNKKFGKILDGALSLTVSALVVKILGVIYKVPLSYILGDGGMGYFNTAYTVYGFFYVLCSAGVPKAITCLVSESTSEVEIKKIFSYSLKLFAVIGSALSLLLLILAPLTVKLIGNPGALFTLIVIGPSVLFVATGGVCRGYLAAVGRLLPIAVSQVIEAACKLILGILLSRLGVSIGLPEQKVAALAVFGITVGSAISTGLLILSCKIRIKGNTSGQSKIISQTKIFKKLLKIALPITVGSSVLTLSSLIDMTVTLRCLKGIGFDSMSANELYGNYTTLAIPMFNLVVSLITPLTVKLLPDLIKMRNDRKRFNLEFNRALGVTSFLVAPCVFVYYYFSFDLLDILFTSAQSARGFEMLSALSFSLFFLCILNVTNTVHEANGRFTVTIGSLLLGTVLKLILEPVLILYTPLGALGVPISTLISHLSGLTVSIVYLLKDDIRIRPVRVIAPALAAMVSFGIPFRLLYPIGGFFGTALGVISLWLVGSILYFVILIIPGFIAHRIGSKVKLTKFSSVCRN